MPTLPTELLTVEPVAAPSEGAQPVVVLRADGSQTALDGVEVDARSRALRGATGEPGQCHRLPDGRWLVGVGAGTPRDWRCAGAALASAMGGPTGRAGDPEDPENPAAPADPAPPTGLAIGAEPPEPIAIPVGGLPEPCWSALVIGLVLGSHRFTISRCRPAAPGRAELVAGAAELDALRVQVHRAGALAAATALARDLSDMPSNIKTPGWLVHTAAGLAEPLAGLSATVWSSGRLAEEGFGGLLAVGGGSTNPPTLLRLDWAPTDADPALPPTDTRHLVLVGKGITFDTGGISIKPAEGMHLMRTDMAGGAAVIGALLAIARLRVPLRVTGLVPAAENHLSGSAYRPGDIVRHYDGTTTEVTNTDAEGRMVLGDALGYAVAELAPDLIVDVATLTGAMKVALGMRTGGLLASDDDLADALLRAADRAGERLWRMPLLEDLVEEVYSDIADLRQAPPGPPAITAALFLREFTDGLPWAHLDIAGPARCAKPYDEVAEGATGFAARTLVELALGYSAG